MYIADIYESLHARMFVAVFLGKFMQMLHRLWLIQQNRSSGSSSVMIMMTMIFGTSVRFCICMYAS
jgi:hypothetical protein